MRFPVLLQGYLLGYFVLRKGAAIFPAPDPMTLGIKSQVWLLNLFCSLVQHGGIFRAVLKKCEVDEWEGVEADLVLQWPRCVMVTVSLMLKSVFKGAPDAVTPHAAGIALIATEPPDTSIGVDTCLDKLAGAMYFNVRKAVKAIKVDKNAPFQLDRKYGAQVRCSNCGREGRGTKSLHKCARCGCTCYCNAQ